MSNPPLSPARLRTLASDYWVTVAAVLVGVLVMSAVLVKSGHILRGSDDQFYYAMAHSLVFDADIDLTNNVTLSPWQDALVKGEHLKRNAEGRIYPRFPVPFGMSLAEAPGLLAGRMLRGGLAACGVAVAGPPGFSALEVNTVGLWLVLIAAIGLQLLYWLLLEIAPPGWSAFSLWATWFGTPLLYYTAVFHTMAHGVAFTLVMAVVYAMHHLRRWPSTNWAFAVTGLLGAMLWLTRPQQVLLGGLVAVRLRDLRGQPLRSYFPGVVLGAILPLGAYFLQQRINDYQTGTATHDAYTATGQVFNYARTNFVPALLGHRVGLLFYSPVVVLAALGYLTTRPARWKWFAGIFLLHGLLQLVVIGLWWGGGIQGNAFGNRMWTESVGAVACGLAMLHQRRGRLRPAIVVLTTICALWTMGLLVLKGTNQRAINEGTRRTVIREVLSLPLKVIGRGS